MGSPTDDGIDPEALLDAFLREAFVWDGQIPDPQTQHAEPGAADDDDPQARPEAQRDC